MNRLIILPEEQGPGGTIIIQQGKRLLHLKETLRATEGASLKLGLLNQGLGRARITKLTEDCCELDWEEFRPVDRHPGPHLIIGTCRPPTVKKILEHGTTLGVSSFHFVRGRLSEKSYSEAKIYQRDFHRECLLLGLSQSARYVHCPSVHLHSGVEACLKEMGPAQVQSQRFLLSPAARSYFHTDHFAHPQQRDLFLSFGPERGWTVEEEKLWEDGGFQPIRVSESVLRVEMAVMSTLAQLELVTRGSPLPSLTV